MSFPTLAPLGPMIPLDIWVRLRGVQEVQSGFDRLRGSMNQLRGIITQASITIFVFSMLMRRQSQTARSLQTVQENTAQTIRKYGRHSLEATQALRRLEQAQENAKIAQIEFGMQTVLSVLSIGTLIFRILDLARTLDLVTLKYYALAAARLIAGDPFAWAAVATVGAVTIGSIILGGGLGGGGSDAQFDQQWQEAGLRVKRERGRMRR